MHKKIEKGIRIIDEGNDNFLWLRKDIDILGGQG